jgi:hypothetical protein
LEKLRARSPEARVFSAYCSPRRLESHLFSCGAPFAINGGMDADRLIAMAQNPRNIVGIFNYCDRWCERCLFTDRCFQYQTKPPSTDVAQEENVEQLLEHIAREFHVAFELLARKMAEFGIQMPPEEALMEPDPDEAAREARVQNDPLVHAARAYCGLVRAWFDAERQALLALAEALVARADQAGDGETLVREAVQVKQALEIIEHDRWFIKPKLARAVWGREWDAAYPDPERHPVQNDSNGSAKVALISIERSAAAWQFLAQWMGGSSTALLLAGQLVQLRVEVEAAFPEARRFVRPAFDHVFV